MSVEGDRTCLSDLYFKPLFQAFIPSSSFIPGNSAETRPKIQVKDACETPIGDVNHACNDATKRTIRRARRRES